MGNPRKGRHIETHPYGHNPNASDQSYLRLVMYSDDQSVTLLVLILPPSAVF